VPLELGISFEDLEKEVSKPIPEGDYEFAIAGYNLTETQEGRPMIAWRLELSGQNAADAGVQGRSVLYNTPLPCWQNPDGSYEVKAEKPHPDAKFITSGTNFLVDLCKGVGYSWEDELDPEEMIRLSGWLRITHREYQGRPREQVRIYPQEQTKD